MIQEIRNNIYIFFDNSYRNICFLIKIVDLFYCFLIRNDIEAKCRVTKFSILSVIAIILVLFPYLEIAICTSLKLFSVEILLCSFVNSSNFFYSIYKIFVKWFWNFHWTQSKIHGSFVTSFPIHFSHLKCGTHCSYPKYCYNKPGQKDYNIKLKRNSVMRLPNCLDIEENVVLRFLRLPPRRLPYLPLL